MVCGSQLIGRRNILTNLIKQDTYSLYADTDSLKLREGYNKDTIEEYNRQVKEKIERVSKELGIDFNKYKPKDIKGNEHLIGLFENESEKGNEFTYDFFITQGAKKYAYISSSDKQIHITVSGVPKKGSCGLKKLEDFKDNFIFKFEDTGKLMMMYNDEQEEFELIDYQGHKEIIKDKFGSCFAPTTYELGKSQEYFDLLTDESSTRARFREEL